MNESVSLNRSVSVSERRHCNRTTWLVSAGLILAMWIMVMLFAGCGSKRLEAGGSYAPIVTNGSTGVVSTNADFALFAADSSFELAYVSLDLAFSFERDNRERLWKLTNPPGEIKHALDRLRPEASACKLKYAQGRRAYIAAGPSGDVTTLTGIVSELQGAAAAAQAVIGGRVSEGRGNLEP